MATYTAEAGGLRRVRLDVPVRAWWSKERAWHGDELTLYVETAYLPDDTPFTIRIFEDGAVPGPEDDEFVAEIKDLKLTNNRAKVPYKLKWDKATRGKELALQTDRFEFYFEVLIEKPEAKGKSNL